MRQNKAFLGRARTEQQRAHGAGLAHAGRGHGRGDVRHSVVDGEAGGDGPAWAVDVEVYGLFRGVGFEEEELGDDGGGHGLVHGAVEADYTFLSFFRRVLGRFDRADPGGKEWGRRKWKAYH